MGEPAGAADAAPQREITTGTFERVGITSRSVASWKRIGGDEFVERSAMAVVAM